MNHEGLVWTDDMSVRVSRGESIDTLVDYISTSGDAGVAWPERLRVLTRRFALSFDDARLAMDRVGGGVARAANPRNEPDRDKDPIAWSSYRRTRGEPRGSTAVARGSDAAMSPVDEALVRLDRYARARAEAHDRAARAAELMQVATSLSSATEACIAAVRDTGCAVPGTPTWVDAIELWNASERLVGLFEEAGQPALAARARQLCGRVVTGLLGNCHAWVGEVMLDAARRELQDGDLAAATSSCEAVIHDFAWLLEHCEQDDDAPFDEWRLGLERLRDAIALHAEAGGEVNDALRARVMALLARPPRPHA